MTEWFETAFGEEYLKLYAHRDADEAQQAVDLILKATGLGAGALVIDAPCGGGRHMHAFEKRGLRTAGFDLSRVLLREAASLAGQKGRIARADLRHLPFKKAKCDLLVNLFSSLGYFDSDETNLAVLSELAALVRPGGWMVVDFLHSDFLRRNLQKESHQQLESGAHVTSYRAIEGIPPRVNKRIVINQPEAESLEFRESVRLFSPDELRQALAKNGVHIQAEFGSYEGNEFTADSPRIILVGRRE